MDTDLKIAPPIVEYATNRRFLNILDALRIDKVKIELASYDPASGRRTGLVTAWLDRDKMLLLCHLVLTRQFATVLAQPNRPPRFEQFGGSQRAGTVESRVLTLEWDPQGEQFARYPYRLTITTGPGQVGAKGAIQPKGEPTAKVDLRLPEADLMRRLLAVQGYLQAWFHHHFAALVAARTAAVARDLAAHAVRSPGVAVPPAPPPVAPATLLPTLREEATSQGLSEADLIRAAAYYCAGQGDLSQLTAAQLTDLITRLRNRPTVPTPAP